MKTLTLATGVFVFSGMGLGLAQAGITDGGPPCENGGARAGFVVEHSSVPGAQFIIHTTDFGYNNIPGGDINPIGVPDGHGGTTTIPEYVDVPGVCDVRNETIFPNGIPGGGGGGGIGAGASADLSIESYVVDPTTGKYVLLNIFNAIALNVPSGVLAIPDLYAVDSNGNLIANTELYSLVNLLDYEASPPSFTFGENLTVVNGVVAGLPGMYFSTDPFTFDPNTGFSDPPYSGNAIVYTDHTLTTPEPSTWAMMLIGFAGLGFAGWRQSSKLRVATT
jgi:hypothetical protein